MATSEIRLLGTVRVRMDDRAVPDQAWPHRRAAQLVKILALTAKWTALRRFAR